jgi:hypothetical protein
MSGIGSILALASQAAQPFASGSATVVDLPGTSYASAADSGSSGATPAAASGAASGDYAMSLLAKITRASADQALALIQGLSVTFGK